MTTVDLSWKLRAQKAESRSATLEEEVAHAKKGREETYHAFCEMEKDRDRFLEVANRNAQERNNAVEQWGREVDALQAEVVALREALEMIYDKWANGDPCFENPDDYLGNAFKLSYEEENHILALLPRERAALAPESKPQQEVCANCGKPYNDHLLWDGNKCEAGSVNGWFPKSIATALKSKPGEEQGK